MKPDFTKKTVDTIAKRAGFQCSNPDCQAANVGPNSASDKATVIGEAAHISGARPGSPRFDGTKSDIARSSVTNAIWLCRNCHKQVDADEHKYSSDNLYRWRERHEQKMLEQLGTEADHINAEIENEAVSQFSEYPAIIRRIVRDKPEGWDFSLTAELFRHLTKKDFQKLTDLENGMYNTVGEHVRDEAVFDWLNERIREMSPMASPAEKLLERLTNSWGQNGEEGNIDEIHHTCLLLQSWLCQIVDNEAHVQATLISDEYQECKAVMSGALTSQAMKLQDIPAVLEDAIEQALAHSASSSGEPLVISHKFVFELPECWEQRLNRIITSLEKGVAPVPEDAKSSTWSVLTWTILAIAIAVLIF